MKFKELTEEDKQLLIEYYFANISHVEKMEFLSTKFEVDERTIRNWWRRELNLTKISTLPKQLETAVDKELPIDTDIVLVSTAQDKTPVNKQQLIEMLAYKKFIEETFNKKVEIVVIPLQYRNPTVPAEYQKELKGAWWDTSLTDYLYYNRVKFIDTIIWADNRLTPTTENPLDGREGFAANNHLIIGHPRIHFKPLARFKDKPIRVMNTTGMLTYRNYSKSSAGDKAYLHHSYGFVVLEKKSDTQCYIPRNVKVKSDGSFIDLIYSVKDGVVSIIDESLGLDLGDLHYRQIDRQKMEATYKLIGKIKPKTVVFNDVLDGDTFNPHTASDFGGLRRKILNNQYKIDQEVNEVLNYLSYFAKTFTGEVKILHSNHDDFLDRAINSNDWKRDLHNSDAYLRYALIQQTVDLREYGNIFGYLVSQLNIPNLSYIKDTDSLEIGGYGVIHGHQGMNGSKGSPSTFRRLNHKLIVNHTHSPLLIDGTSYAGCSCNLRPEYVKSLSDWLHADIIIHSNNKNQLVCYDYDYEISCLL